MNTNIQGTTVHRVAARSAESVQPLEREGRATRTARALGLGVLLVGAQVLGGCLQDEPELSDFKLSASEVTRGGTVTATAMLKDDTGDINGDTMEVSVATEAGLEDVRKLPISLPSDSAREAGISLSLQIAAKTLSGQATVKLVVVDKEGHRSNEVSAPLLIK